MTDRQIMRGETGLHWRTEDCDQWCVTAPDPFGKLARQLDTEHVYRTKTGRVLSAEDFEGLADEAEQGYDVEHLADREPRRGTE